METRMSLAAEELLQVKPSKATGPPAAIPVRVPSRRLSRSATDKVVVPDVLLQQSSDEGVAFPELIEYPKFRLLTMDEVRVQREGRVRSVVAEQKRIVRERIDVRGVAARYLRGNEPLNVRLPHVAMESIVKSANSVFPSWMHRHADFQMAFPRFAKERPKAASLVELTLSKKPEQRSQEDIQCLMDYIGCYPCFRNHPQLSGNPQAMAYITRVLTVRSYQKNQVICKQGDPDTSLMIVLRGTVKLNSSNGDDDDSVWEQVLEIPDSTASSRPASGPKKPAEKTSCDSHDQRGVQGDDRRKKRRGRSRGRDGLHRAAAQTGGDVDKEAHGVRPRANVRENPTAQATPSTPSTPLRLLMPSSSSSLSSSSSSSSLSSSPSSLLIRATVTNDAVVFVRGSKRNRRVKVKQGVCFGCKALTKDSLGSGLALSQEFEARASPLEDCVLLRVRAQEFRDCLRSFQQIQNAQLVRFLQQHVPIFSGWSKHRVNQLSPFVKVKHIRQGGTVFRAGEDAQHLFFVRQGVCEALLEVSLGKSNQWPATHSKVHVRESVVIKPITVAQLSTGSCFGAEFLIGVRTRPFTVVACSDLDLLEMTQENAKRLFTRTMVATVRAAYERMDVSETSLRDRADRHERMQKRLRQYRRSSLGRRYSQRSSAALASGLEACLSAAVLTKVNQDGGGDGGLSSASIAGSGSTAIATNTNNTSSFGADSVMEGSTPARPRSRLSMKRMSSVKTVVLERQWTAS